MKLKKIITTTLLMSAIIPFSQGHAQGKGNPPELFDDFGISQEQNVNRKLPENAMAGKNRKINIHTDLLASDTLTLNLYDDVSVTIIRNRLVDNGKGKIAWIGHVEGEENSEVYLAKRGQVLSGVITIGTDVYEIRYVGNKLHEINQIDLSKNPPDHPEGHGRTVESEHDAFATTSAIDSTTADLDVASAIIDVMVVYTARARNNAGGQAGMEAKIDTAITMANQAYLNSNIDMQLNLVHTKEVAYTESGDILKSHDALTYKSDGNMDDIHSLRDQYGADEVVLI